MAKNTYKAGEKPEKTTKRHLPKWLVSIAVLLVSVTVMLGVAWGATMLIQNANPDTRQPGVTPNPATTRPDANSIPEGESNKNDEADLSGWNNNGASGQEQPELVAPDYRMIALPENGVADAVYFDTVTMVGDSLSQGFVWAKTTATVCAFKGISPRAIYDGSIVTNQDGEKVVAMEEIIESQPDYIYILMGANAILKMEDSAFIEYYRAMIDALQENLHPDVQFYIQSLTPVRPGNSAGFEQDRIDSLNDQLAKLAWEEDIYFVDLTEALKDEEGYLIEEYSANDGYHMNASGYQAWRDYILSHTAHHPRIRYLPGSPYYKE